MEMRKMDDAKLCILIGLAQAMTNNSKRSFVANLEEAAVYYLDECKDALFTDDYIYIWSKKLRGFHTYDADIRYELTDEQKTYLHNTYADYDD